ncbi:hypothetical protein CEQ90_09955 [Lewinellaceae bacterium SD302]|nr:hypothetical protein CEQ90_09955 [Lewinellaceae bacterium SD302]
MSCGKDKRVPYIVRMKIKLTLLFCVLAGSLVAQYDFPVVINGLSVSLDYQSSKAFAARDWLAGEDSACLTDSVLISFTIFPREETPPPGAADSIYLDCANFTSESVEIWWKGSQGQWLVTDSYALIGGFDGCDCTMDCPAATSPILINGLAAAYEDTGSFGLLARDLVAKQRPDHSYSFSDDAADSIRTYVCEDGEVLVLDIFAHAPGLSPRSAQTYVALNPANCNGEDIAGRSPRIIQGLSVPTDQGGLITVPARMFAAPFAENQQLSFGTDPGDSLFSFNCSQIGTGGILLTLYNHQNGSPGPAASTYVIGDDGRRFCAGFAPPIAFNDDQEDATEVSSCEQFAQFQFASREAGEADPDSTGGAGNTVWHHFPLAVEGENTNLTIRPVDSLYLAVYEPVENPGTPIVSGLITTDTTINLCWKGEPFESWSLQIQQIRPDKVTRYYLQTGLEGACTSSLEESTATLVDLFLFPNPSRGRFKIGGLAGNQQIEKLEVYSPTGRLIGGLQSSHVFDLTGRPSGVYYVRVFVNGESKMLSVLHH